MTIATDFSPTTFNTNSELYSWGEPQLRAETRRLKNNLVLLSWLAIATLFLSIAIIPIVEFFDGTSKADQLIVSFILTLFAGLPALYMAWRTWRQRNDWVAIYGEGIGASIRGQQIALRWEDVESIQQNIQTIRVNFIPIKIRKFYLKSKAGKKHVFGNGFKDIEIIGAMMQQQVTSRLLPAVIKRYESGETLDFTGLRIDQQGLQIKQKRLPWSELEAINLQGGMIMFRKQGKRLNWGSLNANAAPNIYVLIGLLKHLGKL